MILPSIMIALGCAYVMHFSTASVISKNRELALSLEDVGTPVAFSGLTTAIGFLGIAFTRIDALREVGIFGGVGVLVTLFAALTVAPALLAIFPIRQDEQWLARMILGRGADWVKRIACERRLVVVVLTASVGLLSLGGLFRLRLETDATRWFVRGSEVRESYEYIRETFSGISPMNIVLRNERGGSIGERETLEAIDGLEEFLRMHSAIGKVISISDLLRQLHGRVMDDEAEPLPLDPKLVEQYLLVLGSTEIFRDFVSADHGAANMMLRVNDNSSQTLISIADSSEGWWSKFGRKGVSAYATGVMYEFARAEKKISEGQIRGLIVVFICIFGIFIFIFQSFRVAFVAIGANVLPIGAAYGVMGIGEMALDAGTVLVGSIAIGVAVDDTVHLVTRFQYECGLGNGDRRALGRALERTLVPLVYTTIVVGAGFGILGCSDFSFTRNLGVLTSSIVVMCLMANVFLVPAMLIREGRKFEVQFGR